MDTVTQQEQLTQEQVDAIQNGNGIVLESVSKTGNTWNWVAFKEAKEHGVSYTVSVRQNGEEVDRIEFAGLSIFTYYILYKAPACNWIVV